MMSKHDYCAVDLFCGAGGSSTGASCAGWQVVAAVNHWPLAVRTHAANHPQARHICQDAALMDPRQLPSYDLLLASPECKGHAKARGKDRPHHDGSRATAWCVVNVAEVTRPRMILVENVPELRDWVLYPQWRSALEALGYRLTENVLDAAEFGVPQNRVRLFVACVRGRAVPAFISPRIDPVPARQIVNLDGGTWSPVRGHCAKTVARVQRGRKQFGECFLMPYYTSGSGETGRSLDRPIGTITTKDRWAIVRGNEMRMLSVREYQAAMGFPADYQIVGTRADCICQLGNAVCPPVAESLCRALLEMAA
jgi:DNA (cytosine-5)-methyltransferase 1